VELLRSEANINMLLAYNLVL